MARIAKGKKLTLRPVRLDDDVWAECQRLGKEHGTINEGLRAKLIAGTFSDLLGPIHPKQREAYATATAPRPFKAPIPKPKDRK